MSNDLEFHNSWLGGEKLESVKFLHNDYVHVISGKYCGEQGSLVSIVKIEPNPSYIVETESGKDIEVKESEIATFNS